MADETNIGDRDRSRVAGREGYGVEYFARKHGVTAKEAHALIRKHGINRMEFDKAAEQVNRRASPAPDARHC